MHQSAPQTISANLTLNLLGALEDAGFDPEPVLERVATSYAELRAPDARVAMEVHSAIFALAVEVSGDPLFPIEVGSRSARVQAPGAVGIIATLAPYLFDGLVAFARYKSLLADDGGQLRATRMPDGLELAHDPGEGPPIPWMGELAMASFLVDVVKGVAGKSASITMHVTSHGGLDLVALTQRLGVPVREGRRFTLRVVDPSAPASLVGDTEAFAALEAVLAERLEAQTLEEKILSILRHSPQRRVPKVEEMARTLGMSSRSLQRELKLTGKAYSELRDQHRAKLANDLLKRGVSIDEISDRLGYSSRTAFHRAYRRWYGCSPACGRDAS